MTVSEARELIKNAVSEAIELCKSKGFVVSGKVYYGDKALRECAEFNQDIILIFGAIKLGVQDMDEEDFCTYGMCCEIKLGLVDDAELQKEISDFKNDVDKMIAEILSSASPADKIAEINERQDKEAEESMRQFNLEMKKMKLRLYGGLGILAIIAAAVIILGFIV